MISCDSDDKLEGKLSEIGLKQHELKTSHQKYTTIVPVKNGGWYIRNGVMTINGESFDFENETYLYSDDRVQDVLQYKDTLIGDWFKLIKKSEKELEIELSENDTENERTLKVFVSGLWMIEENLMIYQDKK